MKGIPEISEENQTNPKKQTGCPEEAPGLGEKLNIGLFFFDELIVEVDVVVRGFAGAHLYS